MRTLPALLLTAAASLAQAPPQVEINAPYVETPPAVVAAMVKLAAIGKTDLVYDLGCGDGRLAIAAAHAGARAVGVDLEWERVTTARKNARAAGVAARTEFRVQDIFETDLRQATVVLMYLLPEVNGKLSDKLRRELRPGARIVSHAYGIAGWPPDKQVNVGDATMFLWLAADANTQKNGFKPRINTNPRR